MADNDDAPAIRLRITVDGRTLDLDPELSLREKIAVQYATGMPWEAFMGEREFGEASFALLWWLARRQNGEARLSFDEFEQTWRTPDEVDLEEVTLDADDPGNSDAD